LFAYNSAALEACQEPTGRRQNRGNGLDFRHEPGHFRGTDKAQGSKISRVREATLLEEPPPQAGFRPARGRRLKYKD